MTSVTIVLQNFIDQTANELQFSRNLSLYLSINMWMVSDEVGWMVRVVTVVRQHRLDDVNDTQRPTNLLFLFVLVVFLAHRVIISVAANENSTAVMELTWSHFS